MMMDAGIDTGDILLSEETEIGESETCGELTDRLSRIGADLLIRTSREMEKGSLERVPQNEAEMTYDPMLNKQMGIISFDEKAALVKGKINGLNPWPCVSVPVGGERMKLLRAVTADENGIAGTVITSDPRNGLVIACGEGAVKILEIQAPGGKRMKPEDYLRGHTIPVGTDLKEEGS